MSLTITSAASDKSLCALSDLKTRMSVSGSSLDTTLQRMIDVASRLICTYLGREMVRQSYTETFGPNWRLRLMLSRMPVDGDSVTITNDGTSFTDFSVEDVRSGAIFAEGGFWSVPLIEGQNAEELIAVSYKGGYVTPNMIAAWSSVDARSLGAWTRPTAGPIKELLYEVTTAGSTDSTEPTWPTTAGTTVTDGTVVWTARNAFELPDEIEEAAILLSRSIYNQDADVSGNVATERLGPSELSYFAPGQSPAGIEAAFPRSVVAYLSPYRTELVA